MKKNLHLPELNSSLQGTENLVRYLKQAEIAFYENLMWVGNKETFEPILSFNLLLEKIVAISDPDLITKCLTQLEFRGESAPLNGAGFVTAIKELVGKDNLFTADLNLLRKNFSSKLASTNHAYIEKFKACATGSAP